METIATDLISRENYNLNSKIILFYYIASWLKRGICNWFTLLCKFYPMWYNIFYIMFCNLLKTFLRDFYFFAIVVFIDQFMHSRILSFLWTRFWFRLRKNQRLIFLQQCFSSFWQLIESFHFSSGIINKFKLHSSFHSFWKHSATNLSHLSFRTKFDLRFRLFMS